MSEAPTQRQQQVRQLVGALAKLRKDGLEFAANLTFERWKQVTLDHVKCGAVDCREMGMGEGVRSVAPAANPAIGKETREELKRRRDAVAAAAQCTSLALAKKHGGGFETEEVLVSEAHELLFRMRVHGDKYDKELAGELLSTLLEKRKSIIDRKEGR